MNFIRYTDAWHSRFIRMTDNCDGSTNCFVEIRLDDLVSNKSQEVHLTRREAMAVYAALGRKLMESDSGVRRS